MVLRLFIATAISTHLLGNGLSARPAQKKHKPKQRSAATQAPNASKADTDSAKASEQASGAHTKDTAMPDAAQKDSPAISGNAAANEMDAYRKIQESKECTVQDLADLLLMYKSEYAKFRSPSERLARAKELRLFKSQEVGESKLTRGILAYALVNVYKPEKGIFFLLTGWQRYALRDAQEAGLIPPNGTVGQRLSGEQLFAIMTDSENFASKKSEWQNH